MLGFDGIINVNMTNEEYEVEDELNETIR